MDDSCEAGEKMVTWVCPSDEAEVLVEVGCAPVDPRDQEPDPSSSSSSSYLDPGSLVSRRRELERRELALSTCIAEAGKALRFVLRQRHERAFRWSARPSEDERGGVVVTLSEEGGCDALATWRWPREHDERERRQLGVCSQRTQTAAVEGTDRTFVCHRAGGFFFLYADLALAPPRVAAAVRAEGFPAEGAPDLECHSLVFLDAVHCPGECPAVPESYRDVGAADELGSLADLSDVATEVVGELADLREGRCRGQIGEEEALAQATRIQRRLGGLWHQAKHLLGTGA